MVGGAISGYCATGRRKNATPPRMTKMIETTEANIGRSMKKCEIRMGLSAALLCLLRRAWRPAACHGLGSLLFRTHLLTRTRLHQTAHHHAVIWPDAILDDAQVVRGKLAERHVFWPRNILRIDDDDKPPRLLSADCSVRNEQCLIGRRSRYPYAREHSRREDSIRIRNYRAAADGARRSLDHIVDEIHAAFVIKIVFVNKLERDLHTSIPAGHVLAAIFRQPLITQIGRFIEGEFEVDGIC